MVILKITLFYKFFLLFQQNQCFVHDLISEHLKAHTVNNSSEEFIPEFFMNGSALLSKLLTINSHVHKLIHYLNDTSNNVESYGMKVAHVQAEMMSLYDTLADLPVEEEYMKTNLSMTSREVEKANDLYYKSIAYIHNFNKLLDN